MTSLRTADFAMADTETATLEAQIDLGEVDHEGMNVVLGQEPKESDENAGGRQRHHRHSWERYYFSDGF